MCGYRMLRVGPVSGERKRMIPTLRSLVLAGVVSYATVLCLTIMSVTGPHQLKEEIIEVRSFCV